MNTDEFFAEAKRLNLRMLGTPEETRAALDLKDAEIARLTGMDDAMRAEWDRECGDTDKILRLLGLEPANCRTDGGSLKLQMVLGALEHRDVMLRRETRKTERERCAKLADEYATYGGSNFAACFEKLAAAIRA